MRSEQEKTELLYFKGCFVFTGHKTVGKIDRVGLVCNKTFIQKLIQRNYDVNFIAVMMTATTPQLNILISLFSLHFE